MSPCQFKVGWDALKARKQIGALRACHYPLVVGWLGEMVDEVGAEPQRPVRGSPATRP